MFLSEILILSADGTCLLSRNFRPGDVNSHDVFLSKIKHLSETPPHFTVDNLHCFYVHRKSLYFCATSTSDIISPLSAVDTLTRFYHIVKDYCGTVNEESVRANFVLIHELLDAILDCGYVQLSATDKVKPYIQSEPVILKSPENQASGLFGLEYRVAPSSAADRPIIRTRIEQEQRKNEIFLDIIERLTILVAANGTVLRSEIHGQVNMKCFLEGCPRVKIGLNKDLVIGFRDKNSKGYGNVHLDNCTFHDSVNLDEFPEHRIISMQPPEGEFHVMTYHLEGDLPRGLPFRIYSYIKDDASSARDVELNLKLRCETPSQCQAIDVTVNIPVPGSTTSISQHLSGVGQSAQLISGKKKIEWKLKKVISKTEQSANFKLIGAKETKSCQLEIGPVVLDFEISGYVCSNLQIGFLRVFDQENSYVPMKWVRYITTSDSYIVKLK